MIKSKSIIIFVILVALILNGCVAYRGFSSSPIEHYNDNYRPLILFSVTAEDSNVGIKSFSSFSWRHKPYSLKMKIFCHDIEGNKANFVKVEYLMITPAEDIKYVRSSDSKKDSVIMEIVPDKKRKPYHIVSSDNPWTERFFPAIHHYVDRSTSKNIQKEAMLVEHEFKGLKRADSFGFSLRGRIIYADGLEKEFFVTTSVRIKKENILIPFWILDDME